MGVMASEKDFQGKLAVCWSCKGPVDAAAFFCETCGAIQPPHAADHFARLGLERSFDIDADELQKRYFALQAKLHPDRFANRSARERAASLAQTTTLNEAYHALRRPLERAAYLLKLAGLEPATESSGTVDDPGLLMESLERREALAAAQTTDEAGQVLGEAERDTESCISGLSAAFAANDLKEAARLTTRLKYLNKLSEEARGRMARLRERA